MKPVCSRYKICHYSTKIKVMLAIKLFNVLLVQSEIYSSCILCGLVDNQAFCRCSRSDAILVMINFICTTHSFHVVSPPLPP